MNTQEKIDARFDPFFTRHGKQWVLATNVIGLLLIPVAFLVTVLNGVKALPGHGFEITVFYWLPIFALLILGIFTRYTRRFERATYRLTAVCIVGAFILSTLVIGMSLPGMPLASHWAAPAPWTQLAVFLPVGAGLISGLAVLHYRHNHPDTKKVF